MSENAKAVIFLVVLFVGLPLFILWFRDKISSALWRRNNPPEKLAAERRAYEARLLNPDWKFYEHHLQRPVPKALRELYADGILIKQSLEYGEKEGISTFEAIDEKNLLDTRKWLGFDAIAIATSDGGDSIYLRPGSSEADKVYITYHEWAETEIFAESVESMLAEIRSKNK